MADMDIYEDARTVSRSDLAAWLRQLASQLESDGRIFYGAAGSVSVADTVRCELEIEQESETELSVEIEFSWTVPTPSGPAADEVEESPSGEQQDEATPEA
ncbi:amphi-Trp domain-containing protein [Micromonospora chokoriensis]|uniref:Amphi-Trp domain-containing protein n=1 Tax=Micromonospora chokoriensis TaxID=356851 RepID=A0A1C4U2D4_9ACTN|nr:amphi-Trp domain-containing protein [Micromonospora chokoriensis]SCE65826.1 amphi-Trp domain-containing protein [Micromonospora chokoriensis]